jgi:hypothetical protein
VNRTVSTTRIRPRRARPRLIYDAPRFYDDEEDYYYYGRPRYADDYYYVPRRRSPVLFEYDDFYFRRRPFIDIGGIITIW